MCHRGLLPPLFLSSSVQQQSRSHWQHPSPRLKGIRLDLEEWPPQDLLSRSGRKATASSASHSIQKDGVMAFGCAGSKTAGRERLPFTKPKVRSTPVADQLHIPDAAHVALACASNKDCAPVTEAYRAAISFYSAVLSKYVA